MQETLELNLGVDGSSIGAFAAYLFVVIAIGVFAARFSSTGIGEFFVGGRQMHRFVVALSAVVSGRSAWLLLGVTGMAYTIGVSAVWAVAGYILAELLLFLYYAKRLRCFSENYDCITLPDFFAARFGDQNGILRLVLVLIILIFMLSYVAAQFVAGGKAFSASFGLSPTTGMVLTALIVLAYTMLGGFLAVSLTDMLQAIFMIVALLLLPSLAIVDRGGLDIVVAEVRRYDPSMLDPLALSFGALAGFLGIGLGSPGNPHILVRYMSIRDPNDLRYSAIVGTSWNVAMAAGAVTIGLVGRVYFPSADQLPAGDTENLYAALAQQHLHPVVFGLVIASIFAAIMSTADSQLLVAASSLVRDLYQKVLRRDAEIAQPRLVLLSRLVVIGLVGVALILGFVAEDLVFWLVLFAWAGLGAAIGPTSILALYWPGTTRAGVIAGLVTGTLVTIAWKSSALTSGKLYELIPAFIASTIVTVVVSRLTSPPTNIDELFSSMDGTQPVPLSRSTNL